MFSIILSAYVSVSTLLAKLGLKPTRHDITALVVAAMFQKWSLLYSSGLANHVWARDFEFRSTKV